MPASLPFSGTITLEVLALAKCTPTVVKVVMVLRGLSHGLEEAQRAEGKDGGWMAGEGRCGRLAPTKSAISSSYGCCFLVVFPYNDDLAKHQHNY